MAKLSGITTPSLTYDEGAAPSTPAAGKVITYAKSDGLMYSKDDAGNETLISGGTGGSGISSGTSNPGSPSTGDAFIRTDIDGGLLIVYDGTRWLGPVESVAASGADFLMNTAPANDLAVGRFAVDDTYGLFLLDCHLSVLIGATNNGSNYYTFNLKWATAANSETSLGTVNTSADTQANWARKSIAVNAVLDSNARVLRLAATETGTAGSMYVGAHLSYRRIIT